MNFLDIESVQFIIKNEAVEDDGFKKFKNGDIYKSLDN